MKQALIKKLYLWNFKVEIKIKVIFEKYEPAADADQQINLVSPHFAKISSTLADIVLTDKV